ncbi:MAG: IS630 transposase-related protein [Cyanobacterium sp.]
MPAPYSPDLRLKALSAIDKGEKKINVCKTFNISRNTLNNWLNQRDSIGHIKPKRKTKSGPSPKICDLKAFEKFVKTHRHLTQKEMAQMWPEDVSIMRISEALKKIGYEAKTIWIHKQEKIL